MTGFSPGLRLRQSGWAWFFLPHQTFEMIHHRKTSVEGIGGHSPERSWGEHCMTYTSLLFYQFAFRLFCLVVKFVDFDKN